ncbi:MAG: hypothetical protein KGN36_16090, partial [Acidobacteriota bacterium]|nr:hypothetical protein [Acidobacteriota bacterium]
MPQEGFKLGPIDRLDGFRIEGSPPDTEKFPRLAETVLRLQLLRLRLKENFDRFNFAIHKEKEMVSFRRWTLALTVLALFAGLASAQIVGTSNPTMTCTTNVTVTPTLRGEGFTEQTGDITLVCTGGAVLATGATIPTVNIAVSLNTAVTSRLLSGNVSEALLLIDEPGSGLQSAAGINPGTGVNWPYGPAAPVNVCPYPTNPLGNSSVPSTTNCLETAVALPVGAGSPLLTMVPPVTTILVPNNSGVTGTSGYNAFEGVVSGNTVT